MFQKNLRTRLKWVCLLLILSNFSFDLIGEYSTKNPVATGIIREFSSKDNRHLATLEITKGKIHEGEFISSNKFVGSIAKIHQTQNSTSQKISVEIEGNAEELLLASTFNVYSNLKLVNILLVIE